MNQTIRRVNDGHQMDGVLTGTGPMEQVHSGKGQAPSEMKQRNTADHVDKMMHTTVNPVEKWDKRDTSCIHKTIHTKKIINNNTSHYSSHVFDPASPNVKAAPVAGKPTPVGAKDHIKFGAAASPTPQPVGSKRQQAVDHVDAVLHSVPPEAKKVRQGSAEEQKNKCNATADHISGIMTAPAEPKNVTAKTAKKLTAPSAAAAENPLRMELAPSDRSADVRPKTGKKLIAPGKTATSAIPYESNAPPNRSRRVVKDHNKSSLSFSSTGNEENTGKRQAESQSNPARSRMLGSHVLGSTQKGSTPVKRSGVRVNYNRAQQDSMGSIFNWG